MKIKSGIYEISSISDPTKFLIGYSNDLEKEQSKHWPKLTMLKHRNPLLNDWVKKYGIKDLVFSVVEYTMKNVGKERKSILTKESKPYFNTCEPTDFISINTELYQFEKKIISQHFLNESPHKKFYTNPDLCQLLNSKCEKSKSLSQNNISKALSVMGYKHAKKKISGILYRGWMGEFSDKKVETSNNFDAKSINLFQDLSAAKAIIEAHIHADIELSSEIVLKYNQLIRDINGK